MIGLGEPRSLPGQWAAGADLPVAPVPVDSPAPAGGPVGRSGPLSWAGGALYCVGLLLLLFVGYLVGFSRVQAARGQQHLVAALNGTGGLPATNGIVPQPGEPVAILTVPSIGLKDVVIDASSLMGVALWSLLLAGAGVLAVVGYRRTRKGFLVYLLAGPVVMALCLLLFQSIAGLLPATL